MPQLIALTAALFVFALCLGVSGILNRNRQDVESRIQDLKADKAVAQQEKRRKTKTKLKKKNTAAARTRKALMKLEDQIYDVGIEIPVQQFLILWASAAVGLPIILTVFGVNWIICAVVAAAVGFGPVLLLETRRKSRKAKMEGQLVEAISILCNALRAGHSFQQAMFTISKEMEAPISEEFGRVFRETQHGMTMADSFERMNNRIGSGDVEMLCTAILIQRDVGGNLAEVLENISGTIQARLALKAEIKTRTASGRLSGYIIGALPILLLVVMSFINPEYSNVLFSTKTGNIMLAVGAVMEVIGFLVIQKIVNVKY